MRSFFLPILFWESTNNEIWETKFAIGDAHELRVMTRATYTPIRTGITFLSVALKASVFRISYAYMYCIVSQQQEQQVLGPHHHPGLEDTAPAARRTYAMLQPAVSPRPCMHLPSTYYYVLNCSVTNESIRTRHANLVTKTGLNHSNAQLVCSHFIRLRRQQVPCHCQRRAAGHAES
jgi:hypothetical protein